MNSPAGETLRLYFYFILFYFKSLASWSWFFNPYAPEEKEPLFINTRSEIHWFFFCALEGGEGEVPVTVVILVFVLSPLLHYSPMDCRVIWIRAVIEGPQPAMERQAKSSHEFAAPIQMHPVERELSVSFARKSSEQNRLLLNRVLSWKLSLLIFFFF